MLLPPSDDWNGVFQRSECVRASRDQTSRPGLEPAARATQTQPAGQDLQEACEFVIGVGLGDVNRTVDAIHSFFTPPFTLFLRSTRRCPFPTAVYSLPASTLWTPCLTLPPSGRSRRLSTVGATLSKFMRHTCIHKGNKLWWELPHCWLVQGPEQQLGQPVGKAGHSHGGVRGVALRVLVFPGMATVSKPFFFLIYILTNLTYPQDCWTVEQSHWCWWKEAINTS